MEEEFTLNHWKRYVDARVPRMSKSEEEEKLKQHEEKYKAIKREVNKRFRTKRAIKEAVLERQYCDSATLSGDESDENLEDFVSKVEEPKFEMKKEVKPTMLFSRSIGF